MSQKIKALIFDFDGTILDTVGQEYAVWQEIYTSHGAALGVRDWAGPPGTGAGEYEFCPYADLEAKIGKPIDREAMKKFADEQHVERMATKALNPGVQEYIADAKRLGIKIGLASNSSREWVCDSNLTPRGMDTHFDAILCGGDVPEGKPNPHIYLAVAATLGAKPGEAIAIEDAPEGVRAAKRAGLFCVAVLHALNRDLDLSEADLRLSSLSDMSLTELLKVVECNKETR